MDIYDLIPLYKILCVSIILLIPLLPAWCLYRIAPKDKVLAKGTFGGIQINATGAVAIFVFLFASIYINMSEVNKSIDNIEVYNKRIKILNDQVQSLQKRIPWKLDCIIQIVKNDNQDINDNKEYNTCLNPDSIKTYPIPMNINSSTREISFYVDDEVLQKRNHSYSITLPGGYGSSNLQISPTKEDSVTKSVLIRATFRKNSNDPNLSGNKEEMLKVYSKSQGLDKISPLTSN